MHKWLGLTGNLASGCPFSSPYQMHLLMQMSFLPWTSKPLRSEMGNTNVLPLVRTGLESISPKEHDCIIEHVWSASFAAFFFFTQPYVNRLDLHL
jgi:hypothetical protein